MHTLVSQIDNIADLLSRHCGRVCEVDVSRLGELRSKLLHLSQNAAQEDVDRLTTEFIQLKLSSKALQFASLAAHDVMLMTACESTLEKYKALSVAGELTEKQRLDKAMVSAVLDESQERFNCAVRRLENLGTEKGTQLFS
jgi:hypothetical protein